VIELYDFQQELVDYLGKPHLVGRIVADDMGLGKTLESIALDKALRKEVKKSGQGIRRTLIVAPLSVHGHWRKHILMMYPKASICVIDRNDRQTFIKNLRGPFNFYICHYEALRLKDMGALRRASWFHIIADEVHRIKNKKAQQTRALKGMRTQFKTGVSGTPADNNPQDFWSILNWLYPRVFTSYWRFVKTYCQEEVTTDERTGAVYRKITGVNKAAVPELRRQIAPYYKRRLKSEVYKQLPPKYYTTIEVDLLPRQRKAYNMMKKEMIAWVGEHEDQVLSAPAVIAQLTRLQQFALASASVGWKPVRRRDTGEVENKRVIVLEDPSAKLDAFMDLVEDNPNKQFVLFSQFSTMIRLANQRMTARKITNCSYTGLVKDQSVRDKMVDDFQAGNIQVFAGTIAAGGESIELFSSSTVCFFDRHWSPSKNNQAEDRCHRIGQRDSVQVIDFVAKNTVDLGRNAQIASKWQTLRYLLGDIIDPETFVRLERAA
jgi:SNF2 family DNA or RNA helicase